MMLSPINLKKLDGSRQTDNTVFLPSGRLKALQSTAYKRGFDTGFESAKKEMASLQIETLNRISQSLQEITFTHVEAQSAIFRSLAPLIEAMVNGVLPTIVQHGLADMVNEKIRNINRTESAGNIIVACAPENYDALRAALSGLADDGANLSLIADDALAPCGVCVKTPNSEYLIAPLEVVDQINVEISAFFDNFKKDRKYG